MKKKNKKKNYQQIHFKNACLTRVGVVLDTKEIISKIQHNELEFIVRQSNRITCWKYLHNEIEYVIVYDKERKELVTIMPYKEGMLENSADRYWWCKDK